MPRISRHILGAVGLLLIGAAFLVASDNPPPLVLKPNQAMADGRFWSAEKHLSISPFDNTIPYQLPGPLDKAWAGEAPKGFTFGVDFGPPFTVVLRFVESHESAPPVLEISLDSRALKKIRVKKGGGLPTPSWRTTGSRSAKSIKVGKGETGKNFHTITVRNIEGSWVGFERITVEKEQGMAQRALRTVGWIAIGAGLALLLAILYSNRNSILGFIEKLGEDAPYSATPLKSAAPAFAALVAALALPAKGYGYFSGLPWSGPAEAVTAAVIAPIIVIFAPPIFRSRIFTAALVLAALAKIPTVFIAPSPGVCMKPAWTDGAKIEAEKTYEGIYANGCFPANPPLKGMLRFPVEYLNKRYFETIPDSRIAFSFSFIKPEGAKRLVIDTNGHPVDVIPASWAADVSSALPPWRGLMIDVEDAPNGHGSMRGVVTYEADSGKFSEWVFGAVFLGGDGNPIGTLESASHHLFLLEGSSSVIWLYRALAGLSDLLITVAMLMAANQILASLWRTQRGTLYAVSALVAVCLVAFIIFEGNYSSETAFAIVGAPGLSQTLGQLRFASPLLILIVMATFFSFRSPMGLRAAFLVYFSITFAQYGPYILPSIGETTLLYEGNDYRTYQRFANVIFNGDLMLADQCPPKWNLPFAYFVALLHILGGESMFLQKILDIYALAAVSTLIYALGRQWGLRHSLAWLAGIFFLLAHGALLYTAYVGVGLTELVSTLTMCLIFFLFIRHKETASRWTLLVVCTLAVIGASWRPNFIPWYFCGFFGLLSGAEAVSYSRVFQKAWSYRNWIIAYAVCVLTWLVLFKARNYILCHDFSYIHIIVKNMYELSGLESRFDSIFAMATMMDPDAVKTTHGSYIVRLISGTVATGWIFALAAGVYRRGALISFPVPLALIAWAGFILFFAVFNILAGYNVRWGVPIMPFWILSFFFSLQILFDRKKEGIN